MTHWGDLDREYKYRYRGARMKRARKLAEARYVDRHVRPAFKRAMILHVTQPKRKGHHGWRGCTA